MVTIVTSLYDINRRELDGRSWDTYLEWFGKTLELKSPMVIFVDSSTADFVEKCRTAGITIPIIPGLKPISTKKQLNLIPHRFSIELPDDLIMEVVKAKDNDVVKQIGIDWCIQQSKELVAAGIPVLHYYSMGKAENIKAIATKVF